MVPDDATDHEVRLASYITTGHLIAVGTATQAARWSEAMEAYRSSHRFLFLAVDAHHRFPGAPVESWPLASHPAEEGVGFSIGACRWGRGRGRAMPLAAAFIAPSVNNRNAEQMDLVVTATDADALAGLVVQTYATNQPHTRAPFSNMLPDFVVAGPEFAWKGHGGLLGAGFFDSGWGVAEGAYMQC